MSEYKLKRFSHMLLEGVGGLGIDFTRIDFYEYRWWECEIHIILGRHYFTIRINQYV